MAANIRDASSSVPAESLISAFLRLMKTIQLANRRSSPKFEESIRQQLSKLRESCKNAHGLIGVTYLEQAVKAMAKPDICELIGINEAVTLERDPSRSKRFFTNASDKERELYQKLLPICRLAYLEEKNGVPEQHAEKLAGIFNEINTAIQYLTEFPLTNKYTYLFHDACLFGLPSPEDCQFERWKAKSNALEFQKKPNMLNPRFRALLPHAGVLERYANNGESVLSRINTNLAEEALIQAELSKELSSLKSRQPKPVEEINAVQTKLISIKTKKKSLEQERNDFDDQLEIKKIEIEAITKEYKHVKETPVRSPTKEEKAARREKLTQLSLKKNELELALAEFAQGIDPIKSDVTLLSAFYERYKNSSSLGHRILIDNGIAPKGIELFYSITSANDDLLIPKLFIDGAEIGYPGCYLTKLDTTSEKGAALAACLGMLTNNCQYIGGAGSACAQHGIASPYGGFYVLFRGDANNPGLDDQILAQSWSWCDDSQRLCLDSIEKASSVNKDLVVDMYRYLGLTLCETHHITQVNTGMFSGITDKVGSLNIFAKKIIPVDYHGYSDSKSQLFLAHIDQPYAFFGMVNSSSLQQMVERNSQAFFNSLFSTEGELLVNESLYQLIAFLIFTGQANDESALFQLVKLAAGKHTSALLELIDLNRNYANKLQQGVVDLGGLDSGAYINLRNVLGETALHIAIRNNDSELITNLTLRGADLNIQTISGDTALSEVLKRVWGIPLEMTPLDAEPDSSAKQPDEKNAVDTVSPREIALKLIHAGADVNIKDGNEDTLLILAVKSRDMDMVRHLIDYHADINASDDDLKTAIFWAAESGNWPIFNELLGKGAQIDGISLEDSDNILMAAARGNNRDIVSTLLSRHAVDLSVRNDNDETVLSLCTPELMALFLGAYPEDKKLAASKESAPLGGQSVLHRAAGNPEAAKMILDLYPEDEKFNVLRELLGYAKDYPESFLAILQLIPQDQILDIIKHGDRDTKGTILYDLVKKPDLLRAVLQRIPESQRLASVANSERHYVDLLHWATRNPEALRMIFEMYPDENILNTIMTITNDKTVLHWAASNPESLSILFDLYPNNDERLLAIKMANLRNTNFNKITVLESAGDNMESIRMILSLYGLKERLTALYSWSSSGGVIHNAVEHPEIMMVILDLLPPDERLDAVTRIDLNKERVLYKLAGKPALVRAILEKLPQEQRLIAIKKSEGFNGTVLHEAASNSESLRFILELYPIEERLAALKMTGFDSHESVLQLAAAFPESLKTILSLIPEGERLDAITYLEQGGWVKAKSALQIVMKTNKLEYLSEMISWMPEDQKLNVMKMVLQKYADNPESLKAFLDMLPPDKKLTLVDEPDEKGQTVLSLAAVNVKSLKMILDLYSEEQKPAAIMKCIKGGHRIFWTRDPAALIMILALIPAEQRLSVIEENDTTDGILHAALESPEHLKELLSLIPEDQFEKAINLRDRRYYSTVQNLAEDDYPESAQVITEMLAAIILRRETLPIKENNLSFFSSSKPASSIQRDEKDQDQQSLPTDDGP